jgi:hypothetical protein
MRDGQVTIAQCFFADFDCDCDVDVVDVMAVVSLWNCESGDGCYDAGYDLDSDGDIDIVDIMQVASHWGWACTTASAFERQVGVPVATTAVARLVPADPVAEVGQTFTVGIMLDAAEDLGGFGLVLKYDPDVVHIQDVALGNFLGNSGRDIYPLGPAVDNDVGSVRLGGFGIGEGLGASGGGVLATITFVAQQGGSPGLMLQEIQLTDTSGRSQPVTLSGQQNPFALPALLP